MSEEEKGLREWVFWLGSLAAVLGMAFVFLAGLWFDARSGFSLFLLCPASGFCLWSASAFIKSASR